MTLNNRRISYRFLNSPRDLDLYEWVLIKGSSVKSAFLEGKKSHLFLKESKRYYIIPLDHSEMNEVDEVD